MDKSNNRGSRISNLKPKFFFVNFVSLKPSYKPLISKWVFKVKKGKNSKVLLYKVR